MTVSLKQKYLMEYIFIWLMENLEMEVNEESWFCFEKMWFLSLS